MAKLLKRDKYHTRARIASLLLMILALIIVGLAGCRRPEPPARGWARLEELRPLHPNQAMLADIDRRLDALAAQRARLLEHPDAPLPPEFIPLDLPAAGLPSPEPVSAPPRPVIAIEPRLAELRARLEEEMNSQYSRMRQQAEAERNAAYTAKERALQRDADERRETAAREFATRITPAKVRLKLANEQVERARNDADSAQTRAIRAREQAGAVIREYAKNPEKHRKEISKAEEDARYYENRAARLRDYAAEKQQAAEAVANQLAADMRKLDAGQAQIDEELRQSLADIAREQVDEMRDRLAEWRRQAEDTIDRRLAEHAARLTAENNRLAAEPPPSLRFPDLPPRSNTINTGRMRIAVNTADFTAFQRRLDAARAIDETAEKLRREREQCSQAIDRDTRDAARAIAAEHNWTVELDKQTGRDITNNLRRWMADYWPEGE